jgi:hypothetical protein
MPGNPVVTDTVVSVTDKVGIVSRVVDTIAASIISTDEVAGVTDIGVMVSRVTETVVGTTAFT